MFNNNRIIKKHMLYLALLFMSTSQGMQSGTSQAKNYDDDATRNLMITFPQAPYRQSDKEIEEFFEKYIKAGANVNDIGRKHDTLLTWMLDVQTDRSLNFFEWILKQIENPLATNADGDTALSIIQRKLIFAQEQAKAAKSDENKSFWKERTQDRQKLVELIEKAEADFKKKHIPPAPPAPRRQIALDTASSQSQEEGKSMTAGS